MCKCVCVSKREREREREIVRMSVCVCVHMCVLRFVCRSVCEHETARSALERADKKK